MDLRSSSKSPNPLAIGGPNLRHTQGPSPSRPIKIGNRTECFMIFQWMTQQRKKYAKAHITYLYISNDTLLISVDSSLDIQLQLGSSRNILHNGFSGSTPSSWPILPTNIFRSPIRICVGGSITSAVAANKQKRPCEAKERVEICTYVRTYVRCMHAWMYMYVCLWIHMHTTHQCTVTYKQI